MILPDTAFSLFICPYIIKDKGFVWGSNDAETMKCCFWYGRTGEPQINLPISAYFLSASAGTYAVFLMFRVKSLSDKGNELLQDTIIYHKKFFSIGNWLSVSTDRISCIQNNVNFRISFYGIWITKLALYK